MRNHYKTALLFDRETARNFLQPEIIDLLYSFTDFESVESFPHHLDDTFLSFAIKDAKACICCDGADILTDQLLKSAPDLKLIADISDNFKPINSEYIDRKNIKVININLIRDFDIAETLLGIIILSLKKIYSIEELTGKGLWRSIDNPIVKHDGDPDIDDLVP